MKNGSFLSLQKHLLVLLHWAYDDQMAAVAERVEMSHKSAIQCFQYLRDACSWKLMQNPIRLGGAGAGLHTNVCEADESYFSHKPKVKLTMENIVADIAAMYPCTTPPT